MIERNRKIFILKAIKDGFMSGAEGNKNFQFCTKGNTYQVIYKNNIEYKIIDDLGQRHVFGFPQSNKWFEIIEVSNVRSKST